MPEQENDVKNKMREAMERKRAQHSAAQAAADERDPSKIHGAHGPASQKRSFRRKSGG